MGLNETPSANRTHIGFFGCRNVGKSSVVNAVTNQELSVVSDVMGTTTDPVLKSMELLPLGPVVIVDTPGFDDEGSLGEKRVRKTRQVLNRVDVAVLVVDATHGLVPTDSQLIEMFEVREIPFVVAFNKSDLLAPGEDPVGWNDAAERDGRTARGARSVRVSALTGEGIDQLKETIGALAPEEDPNHRILGDLVSPNDFVMLVCPIDESAPKGRLILPQVQAIRDALDVGAIPIVCREFELEATLAKLGTAPALVVTDSQAFAYVAPRVPDEIPLTSFSILMARYKRFLRTAAAGVVALDHLKDGDRILVAEGCTHHRQCEDIGTVKIPRWLREYTGKELEIEFVSGRDYPEDLSPYALVLHCGACMNSDRDVRYRMRTAQDQGIPFTNYGIAIAQMTGILERSVRILPDIHSLLEDSRG